MKLINLLALTPLKLFILQILAHCCLMGTLIYGSYFQLTIVIFIYFLTGCLGGTITYHRLLSHRSWECNKTIEKILVLFSTVSLSGSAISWVSTHRKHHRYVDTIKDPHSPSHKGFFKMHYMSMFESTDIKYAPDLIRQSFYRFQHKYYFIINIVWAIFIVLLFQDVYAIAYAWLAPAALLWSLTSCIITLSHRQNKIHNDIPLAVLVWGEGYHENHHNNPKEYRFGKYDISAKIIDLIKK
jgi:fatty-acid desaturase